MARIFFVEATIYRLHVEERTIIDAAEDTNFTVKVDLIVAPSLTIRQNDESFIRNTEPRDYNCTKNLDYYSGRACHFVGNRREIVNSLKRNPLKIGIYRENERFPVCHGVVPFSGCVCDLVTETMEEPTRYEFRETFNLIDPGGDRAGRISLGIILMDLGNHVVTSFVLDRDSFVLKNDPEGVEYRCGKLKNSDDHEQKNYGRITDDECRTSVDYSRENLMLDVAGISLAAGTLSRGKPEVKKVRQPLENSREQSDGSKVKPGNVDGKKSAKKSKKKTK